MTVLYEYVMTNIPKIIDFAGDVPNGMFIPNKHNYNANNKRKKGKKK